MLIELTTSRATDRGVNHPGDRLDLPEQEARTLIQSGSAIPVRSAQPVETTDAPASPARATRAVRRRKADT